MTTCKNLLHTRRNQLFLCFHAPELSSPVAWFSPDEISCGHSLTSPTRRSTANSNAQSHSTLFVPTEIQCQFLCFVIFVRFAQNAHYECTMRRCESQRTLSDPGFHRRQPFKAQRCLGMPRPYAYIHLSKSAFVAVSALAMRSCIFDVSAFFNPESNGGMFDVSPKHDRASPNVKTPQRIRCESGLKQQTPTGPAGLGFTPQVPGLAEANNKRNGVTDQRGVIQGEKELPPPAQRQKGPPSTHQIWACAQTQKRTTALQGLVLDLSPLKLFWTKDPDPGSAPGCQLKWRGRSRCLAEPRSVSAVQSNAPRFRSIWT